MYRILDLDNCISDDEWRIRFIDKAHPVPAQRYHKYHSLSAFDDAANPELWRGTGHKLLIFTGRSEQYRYTTEHWLRKYGIRAERLVMRPDSDHCPAQELKLQYLNETLSNLGIGISQIVDAHDDHPEVVRMYRINGIAAIQTSIHDKAYP